MWQNQVILILMLLTRHINGDKWLWKLGHLSNICSAHFDRMLPGWVWVCIILHPTMQMQMDFSVPPHFSPQLLVRCCDMCYENHNSQHKLCGHHHFLNALLVVLISVLTVCHVFSRMSMTSNITILNLIPDSPLIPPDL